MAKCNVLGWKKKKKEMTINSFLWQLPITFGGNLSASSVVFYVVVFLNFEMKMNRNSQVVL